MNTHWRRHPNLDVLGRVEENSVCVSPMDWSLQNTFSEDYRDSSSETVTEVVACLWAASERFHNQGDSTNAILVLSKLICSRFGCASLEVELGTRLRLAELCSTRVEYCEIAMEQLNRAVRHFWNFQTVELFLTLFSQVGHYIAWKEY